MMKAHIAATCGVWIKQPTNIEFNAYIGVEPPFTEHYYNIEGKKTDNQIIIPYKEFSKENNLSMLQRTSPVVKVTPAITE